MFFKGWPDPPDTTIKRGKKHKKPKKRHHEKPNYRKRWLKANPLGSPGRLAWEQRKELDGRFRALVRESP